MKDDQHLTTSELAEVLGVLRAKVDRWRTPTPRYRSVYDRRSKSWVSEDVTGPPPIRWCKEDGRVLYHIVDVEAFIERDTSSRGAERLARFRQLLKTRNESGSVSLEDFLIG